MHVFVISGEPEDFAEAQHRRRGSVLVIDVFGSVVHTPCPVNHAGCCHVFPRVMIAFFTVGLPCTRLLGRMLRAYFPTIQDVELRGEVLHACAHYLMDYPEFA